MAGTSWQVRDPFEIDRFIGNLHSTRYNWDELNDFLPRGGRPGPERMIKLIESKAGMFQSLSDEEKEIIADSRRHKSDRLIESTATTLRALEMFSP
jgi:hypothetical protein